MVDFDEKISFVRFITSSVGGEAITLRTTSTLSAGIRKYFKGERFSLNELMTIPIEGFMEIPGIGPKYAGDLQNIQQRLMDNKDNIKFLDIK